MKQLKLMALDGDDLKVMSAFCQDAVLKVSELEYIPAENRFVISMNRFVWEDVTEKDRASGKKAYERRKSVLQFARVNKVQVSGINRKDGEMVVSLLAITFDETDAPAGTLELVFAGDGAIRLDVECIEGQLMDTPAAWETKSLPDHE